MSSQMIEQVARAIYYAVPQNYIGTYSPQPSVSWDDVDGDRKERCRAQAHAAIEAMSQPDAMMLEAAAAIDCDLPSGVQVSGELYWRSMIGAALR